jgi:hypothetical protein
MATRCAVVALLASLGVGCCCGPCCGPYYGPRPCCYQPYPSCTPCYATPPCGVSCSSCSQQCGCQGYAQPYAPQGCLDCVAPAGQPSASVAAGGRAQPTPDQHLTGYSVPRNGGTESAPNAPNPSAMNQGSPETTPASLRDVARVNDRLRALANCAASRRDFQILSDRLTRIENCAGIPPLPQ